MDKDNIVEELNEYFKSLDQRLSVVNDDGDLTLDCNGFYQAWFKQFNRNKFGYSVDGDLDLLFIKEGYLTKFYNKAIELLDEFDKYTVSLSDDSTTNYLNIDKTTGGFFFSTNDDTDKVQAYFTKTEIERMKNDPRFKAINFDKAVIEEVNC